MIYSNQFAIGNKPIGIASLAAILKEENFKEEINEKLSLIKEGNLKPDFPIPENEEELRSFLGINKITDDEQRKTRQRLRNIAKEDSAHYGMI